ncbi:MFS transporter [Pusillimonas sp. SM2304]|uniref:MFS transporter n=1 Tax=Pusillimonas sp. SM2304 TaxID=3073241 RepID=UPI0028764C65|nr:MFS transporter [Pusillimonas sp. SM2304]MDS1141553.1 MFS transporter [Pusillimonas sp. SM2304]
MQAGAAGTAESAAPSPDAKAGGLTTALGVGQICSWGTLYYSFPLIAEAMGAEFGWPKFHLYAAATLGLVLAALATYSVGVAVDRGHGRWVMGLSSLGAGILLILWSQVDSLTSFYLLTAGVGLLQAATLYEPAFAVLARRVGAAQSRRAITTLTLWGGFASTVFIPLIQWLMDHWGWRDTLIVLGLVNVLLCATAHLVFIRPERDCISTEPGAAFLQIDLDRAAVHEAVRRPVFWALLLALTVYAAMFSAFTFHMYPMFIERGMNTAAVVQAIALIGPAQVAGRILISVFAARASMRVIGSVVVASFPVSFGALLWVDAAFWPVAAICVTYGAANGIFTIVRGLVVPEMLTRHAYGAINGLLTVPTNLARAAAPLAAALLWSTTASYNSVLIGIIVSAIVLAASFWLAAWLRRKPGRL